MIKTILITLILVSSPHGVDTAFLKSGFKYAQEEALKAGVHLKLTKIEKVRRIRAQESLSAYGRYYLWNNWRDRHNIEGRLFVAGGSNIGDLSGLASTCEPTGVAVGILGSDDPYVSNVIIAHEIGHLLGANHTTDGSIMNTPVIRQDSLPDFNETSLEEIKACIYGKLK